VLDTIITIRKKDDMKKEYNIIRGIIKKCSGLIFTVCGKLSLLVFLLTGNLLYSHPHTFIINQYEVIVDSSGFESVTVHWEFDEMFSESLILDFDLNHNRIFEPDEVNTIYNTAFINLKNYDYFLDVKIDGDIFTIETVKHFNVKVSDNNVIYEFSFFPISEGNNQINKLQLMCYDPSYYIMVSTYQDTGLTIVNNSGNVCSSKFCEKFIDFENFGKLPVCEVTIEFKNGNE
jgi:ABC-type uncharacterized transport system substrate-binding protein